MPTIWAQIELDVSEPYVEAAPTNVLWFQTAVGTTPYEDILDAIAAAYTTMSSQFSACINQNDHRVRMYDLADETPRAPVLDDTFNLSSAPAGAVASTQLAGVVSFQGPRVSGVSQARRRGRVYLGPLDTSAVGSDGRLSSAAHTALQNFGISLLNASVGATDWFWIVRSRVAENNVAVDNGWVDNRIDIQRRRALPATSRLVFSTAP